jgi:hypothetical protein
MALFVKKCDPRMVVQSQGPLCIAMQGVCKAGGLNLGLQGVISRLSGIVPQDLNSHQGNH